MAGVLRNLLSGAAGQTVDSSTTTIPWGEDPGFPTVDTTTGPMAVTVDVDGTPEIVEVTAHTSGASSSTATRGTRGTTAAAHTGPWSWEHAPTAEDVPVADVVTSSVSGTHTAETPVAGPDTVLEFITMTGDTTVTLPDGTAAGDVATYVIDGDFTLTLAGVDTWSGAGAPTHDGSVGPTTITTLFDGTNLLGYAVVAVA